MELIRGGVDIGGNVGSVAFGYASGIGFYLHGDSDSWGMGFTFQL